MGTPPAHTIHWIGEWPRKTNSEIMHALGSYGEKQEIDIGEGVRINYTFSRKPNTGTYNSYCEKIRIYVDEIEREAEKIDPKVQRRYGRSKEDTYERRFKYTDTWSTRAKVGGIMEKMNKQKIGIVGLGGTGAYILDLVAKCEVEKIMLWDDDIIEQHNAFRMPGALEEEDIKKQWAKVVWLQNVYSQLKLGIVCEQRKLTLDNIEEAKDYDTIFLATDPFIGKKELCRQLVELGCIVIETGTGIVQEEIKDKTALSGLIRVTYCNSENIEESIRFVKGERETNEEEEYDDNIQTADINCLAASIAVGIWKQKNRNLPYRRKKLQLDFPHRKRALHCRIIEKRKTGKIEGNTASFAPNSSLSFQKKWKKVNYILA